MNFKDLYKSANDSIHGDRKLIDGILNKTDNKTSFKLKYTALCTATLLIVISVGVFSSYINTNQQDGSRIAAKKDSQSSNSTVKKDDTNKKSDFSNLNDDNMIAKIDLQDENSVSSDDDENLSKAQEEFSAIENDIESVADDIGYSIRPNYDSVNIHEEADSKSFTQRIGSESESKDNKSEDNSDTTSAGGMGGNAYSGGSGEGASGGASVASIFPTETAHKDYMTISDYIDYLNIDIMSLKPTLPGGMTIKFPPIVSIDKKPDGNIVSDLVRFSAQDESIPNKIITLSTTKLSGEASNVMNNSSIPKIKINNYTAAVSYDSSANSAYFKYGDVWVSVASVGVTKEEFDIFLSTLLK